MQGAEAELVWVGVLAPLPLLPAVDPAVRPHSAGALSTLVRIVTELHPVQVRRCGLRGPCPTEEGEGPRGEPPRTAPVPEAVAPRMTSWPMWWVGEDSTCQQTLRD